MFWEIMAKSNAQQLAEIEVAITNVLEGGQKLESDEDILEYADLSDLYAIRDKLEKKLALSTRTGRTLAQF